MSERDAARHNRPRKHQLPCNDSNRSNSNVLLSQLNGRLRRRQNVLLDR